MEDAITLFEKVYLDTRSLELAIAELKRKGFSRQLTIKVLMSVLEVSIVEADELVMHSVAWHD